MKQSLWAIAAAACFSIMGAFAKFCTEDLGSFELVFYRSLSAPSSSRLWWPQRRYSQNGTLPAPYRSFSFGCHERSAVVLCLVADAFRHLYDTYLYNAAIYGSEFHHSCQVQGGKSAVGGGVGNCHRFIGICLVMKPGLGTDEFIPALICLGVALIDLAAYWQMKQMGRLNEPSYRIVFYFCVLGMVFAAVGTVATTGFHVPNLTGIAGLLAWDCLQRLGRFAPRVPTLTAICCFLRVWLFGRAVFSDLRCHSF